MCKRYGGGVDFVMELDVDTGLQLIGKAFKEDTDDRLFTVWNIEHILMSPENRVSFDEYRKQIYDKANSVPVPKLTAQEIIAKAQKIKAADQRGR